MEFVKHDVVPLTAFPGFAPEIGARVYRLTGTVDVFGLKPGRRVGNLAPVRYREPIANPWPKPFHEGLEKAVCRGRHGERIVSPIDHEVDAFFTWRPETKAYPTGLERGAVSPFHCYVFRLARPGSSRFNRQQQIPARRKVPGKIAGRDSGRGGTSESRFLPAQALLSRAP
jgi:hypothetical protein